MWYKYEKQSLTELQKAFRRRDIDYMKVLLNQGSNIKEIPTDDIADIQLNEETMRLIPYGIDCTDEDYKPAGYKVVFGVPTEFYSNLKELLQFHHHPFFEEKIHSLPKRQSTHPSQLPSKEFIAFLFNIDQEKIVSISVSSTIDSDIKIVFGPSMQHTELENFSHQLKSLKIFNTFCPRISNQFFNDPPIIYFGLHDLNKLQEALQCKLENKNTSTSLEPKIEGMD